MIVAFLGEGFLHYKSYFYSAHTPASFLQSYLESDTVIICSPSKFCDQKPSNFSSVVNDSCFFSFPFYSSTKEFFFKTLFEPNFLREYIKKSDEVIANHKSAYFWIRTPSLGSIVFGLRALKAGENVINHICADASSTWKDKKYTGINKLYAYIASKISLYFLKKICRHQNTLNLCTGDALENFCKKIAPTRTFQFVDTTIKRKQLSCDKNENNVPFKLLFVGRIVEDKGIFDLLYAAGRFADKFSLTIVGDGNDLEKAKTYAAQHVPNLKVVFTGQLANQSLTMLYSACNLVVVPSNNFYEGFPRVIMEAWSHHKPVIVSDVGGVKAFVRDGINGLIYPPGDRSELYSLLQKVVTDKECYVKILGGAIEMESQSLQVYWFNQLDSYLNKVYG